LTIYHKKADRENYDRLKKRVELRIDRSPLIIVRFETYIAKNGAGGIPIK